MASVGRPFSNVAIRIVDPAGTELLPGGVGEVVVRGDPVMRGYWRNPEATAAALQGGWLHTGDIGSLDEAGYLALQGRSKDRSEAQELQRLRPELDELPYYRKITSPTNDKAGEQYRVLLARIR